MTSPDLLNVPLNEGEALNVRQWIEIIAPRRYDDWCRHSFEGNTPEYVALLLRMDGYTSVRDRDVLRAAGRI